MGIMTKLVDPDKQDSFSNSLRRKRFALFLDLVSDLKSPIKILDVGGTDIFWETMNFGVDENAEVKAEITLLNLGTYNVKHKNFKSVTGDARDMKEFRDGEFDIVFSNSVIEHVGDYSDQKRMAAEVRRVSKRYYVQTPNYFFPMEPHTLFPGFQWLPMSLRATLLSKFRLGNTLRVPDRVKALDYVKHIQLLSRRQMRELLPDATIHEEKLAGLTKSFICIRK